MKWKDIKILNMENFAAYVKELALKQWIYQNVAVFLNMFLEIMGRFSHIVLGPKKFASPPLDKNVYIK